MKWIGPVSPRRQVLQVLRPRRPSKPSEGNRGGRGCARRRLGAPASLPGGFRIWHRDTPARMPALPAGHFFLGSYLIHEICVTSWFSEAKAMCALVANFGVTCAGKVASVASPTRKTLKSLE